MERKNAVLREAEEIIEKYIARHGGKTPRFYQKRKRPNPKGLGLVFGLGISLLLWGLMLWWIF